VTDTFIFSNPPGTEEKRSEMFTWGHMEIRCARCLTSHLAPFLKGDQIKKKNSNPTNLFNRLSNFTKTRQCGFESFYKTFDVSNCMEHSRFLLGVATGGCLRLSPEGLLGSSFWIVLHQLGGPVFGPFNIFYPLTLEVATGVASLLSAECLLASHFESFSINLTGFRTIEKYP